LKSGRIKPREEDKRGVPCEKTAPLGSHGGTFEELKGSSGKYAA